MIIYSSALEARHYYDENAENIAFLEFLTALIFGQTICVAQGSLLDCMSLHNLWLSFYDSFVKYSDRYISNSMQPLMIVVDKRLFPYENQDNIAMKIANDYLAGNPAPAQFANVVLPSREFEFSVVSSEEMDELRRSNDFGKMREGNTQCLSKVRNIILCESLRRLNDYCNRFKAVKFTEGVEPIDLLTYFTEGCRRLVSHMREQDESLSQEIDEGLNEMARTPMESRLTAATMIKKARQCMPNTFDHIVMPFCRGIISQISITSIKPQAYINYEISPIMKYKYSVFEAAMKTLKANININYVNSYERRSINLSPDSERGKLQFKFDWDRFHDVVFSNEAQRCIRALKMATNRVEKRNLLERHIGMIAKELSNFLELRLGRIEGDTVYLTLNIQRQEKLVYNIAVEFVDKLIDYLPLEQPKELLFTWVRTRAMKNALEAICPVSIID